MIATRSVAGTLWSWIVAFALVGWVVGTAVNLIALMYSTGERFG